MWREQTRVADFPHGWGDPVVALDADVFEASHTYAIQGTSLYVTVIEAQHPDGGRYYKAYVARQLADRWQPLADSVDRSFASSGNLRFTGERWTESVSHGELLRAGTDERMEINPHKLQMIFQGVLHEQMQGRPYGQIPWRLGLLSRE
jgi:hypothetical protein